MEEKRDGSKIIAAAITDLVNQSGLSVKEVAVKAKLSRQYIYDMMSGGSNVTLARIEAVFEACGESFADWLDSKSWYGRDRRIYDRLRYILKRGLGRTVIAARTSVEGWFLVLCAERSESDAQALEDIKKDA